MKVEKVYVSFGMTINIGNYESIKVDSGITVLVEEDDVKETYEKAWKLVEEDLNPLIESIREKYKNRFKI